MNNPLLPEKESFSIGEASQFTHVEPYVLRYWESEFHLLRPVRRQSGHRKYTKKDLESIEKIKELLYERKFTIAGAKKYLLQESRRKPEQLNIELNQNTAAVDLIQEVTKTLEEIAQILK